MAFKSDISKIKKKINLELENINERYVDNE